MVRFVSLRSGAGKTEAIVAVALELRRRGLSVAAVKHASHGLDVEDKDSYRYLASGIDRVVVSAPGLGAVYYGGWEDSLSRALELVERPLVLVEGFREVPVGDAVAVAHGAEELEELARGVRGDLVAFLVRGAQGLGEWKGVRIVGWDSLGALADILVGRALEKVEAELPRTDCGACGYGTCKAFARAYLAGRARWCPAISTVKLTVDGIDVPLNPFVRAALRSILEGFISTLKGVPQQRKKVVVELEV